MERFDGRLMVFPALTPTTASLSCAGCEDWLDKLGLNPDPDGDLCITLDDIAPVARAFGGRQCRRRQPTVGMAFRQ